MKNFILFCLWVIPIIGIAQTFPSGGPSGSPGSQWIFMDEPCYSHTGTEIYAHVNGYGANAQVTIYIIQTSTSDCGSVTGVSITGPSGSLSLNGSTNYSSSTDITGCGLYTVEVTYPNPNCTCNSTILVPCVPDPCSIVVSCDDGLACTVNDVRIMDQSGLECVPCQGEPADCNNGTSVPCDDGNPCTTNDVEIISPCNGSICTPCQGTAVNDSDGDGVCDEDECEPNDPSQTHGIGDSCDDGDPYTVNDVYNDNCICEGEPNTCEGVNPDDGCPLTTDILNDDCTITNIPPDPDDGCHLTTDYFDARTCAIVNLQPDVDDGCEGTYDYFDEYNCEIVNQPLPCDDGNLNTVGDKYDENCECVGCDPCEMEGEEWEILCELLNE